MDLSPLPAVLRQARPPRWKRILQRVDSAFIAVVVLPTLLASLYYGLMASDVFISESRFVVRSPQRQVQTGLGALLQGTGFARSQDDTYSVLDFIRSRDALRKLDGELRLRAAFSDPGIDFLSRFPALDHDPSFEALYRHYLKHIDVTYDTASSIAVLRVRAFRAEDAFKINGSLLQMGEELINQLNTRSRNDLIEAAKGEVRQAEERAKDSALALSAYRAKGEVFDPERQGTVQLQSTARLREELVAAEAQLAQVRQLSPSNPQIPGLLNRVEVLRRSIAGEEARLVGKESGLTSKSPVYDRLQLEKTFADRQLGSALAALDAARNEAARKQLYLEHLVEPNQPDSAIEPRRWRSILTVFVVGLVAWGVVSLIVASVREHLD